MTETQLQEWMRLGAVHSADIFTRQLDDEEFAAVVKAHIT